MVWSRFALSWVIVALACTGPLRAFGEEEAPPPPEAHAILVDETPVIDGILDDAAWDKAEVIDRFTQVEPKNGEAPTYATEVRVLTDGETLFIGFRGYDDEPDKIVANRMGRDELFFYDDHFLVSIDPSHNHRSGYFFLVNALGGRRDGSFERDIVEANWDGIWYADSKLDAEGWTAEIAIPFRTVAL